MTERILVRTIAVTLVALLLTTTAAQAQPSPKFGVYNRAPILSVEEFQQYIATRAELCFDLLMDDEFKYKAFQNFDAPTKAKIKSWTGDVIGKVVEDYKVFLAYDPATRDVSFSSSRDYKDIADNYHNNVTTSGSGTCNRNFDGYHFLQSAWHQKFRAEVDSGNENKKKRQESDTKARLEANPVAEIVYSRFIPVVGGTKTEQFPAAGSVRTINYVNYVKWATELTKKFGLNSYSGGNAAIFAQHQECKMYIGNQWKESFGYFHSSLLFKFPNGSSGTVTREVITEKACQTKNLNTAGIPATNSIP